MTLVVIYFYTYTWVISIHKVAILSLTQIVESSSSMLLSFLPHIPVVSLKEHQYFV